MNPARFRAPKISRNARNMLIFPKNHDELRLAPLSRSARRMRNARWRSQRACARVLARMRPDTVFFPSKMQKFACTILRNAYHDRMKRLNPHHATTIIAVEQKRSLHVAVVRAVGDSPSACHG
ncbi:MAG TPA: hypothetical protein VKU82_06315 [Planctomycetaceae bacterium]|nr:hypothetical protein [Planctomycetaceae bacterium]